MELPDGAARALETLRRQGRTLRFTVDKVCDSGRFRLSVRYFGDDGEEIRLGLLYAEEREGLCRLREQLMSKPEPAAGA